MSLPAPARACGIDFGTSNSTVGWWRPDTPPLLPLEEGKVTLPSVVFFNADENTVSFGRSGLAEYLDGYEGRLMRSLKSLLGSSLLEGKTEVQGRPVYYKDLLSRFIGELRDRANRHAGRSFDLAVLGRPVHFVDDDSEADRLAEETLGVIARSVGFREVSFQYEPIAAAYHYEQEVAREELVLIADIGGGTSDFSLIRLGPERATREDRRDDLLGNGGVHIGGTDFDRVLSLGRVMPLLGHRSQLKTGREMPSGYYIDLATWHTINFVYSRTVTAELQQLSLDSAAPAALSRLLTLIRERAGHWLALQVEEAKIALSQADTTAMALDRLEPGLSHAIHRQEFEDTATGLVERVAATVTKVLADAQVAPERVDTLFFTGGASGIPVLREAIARALPAARRVEGELFGSIGAGLAVDAWRRYG